MSSRSQIARLGGLARSAAYDGREVTANARQVFRDSFLEAVDPTGRLRRERPEEAARRAQAARKLHYARLALKSAQVRAKKTGNEKAAGGAPTAVQKQEVRPDVRASATSRQV